MPNMDVSDEECSFICDEQALVGIEGAYCAVSPIGRVKGSQNFGKSVASSVINCDMAFAVSGRYGVE